MTNEQDNMPTRYLLNVNPRSRLAIWAWSPVIVLRISLVTIYLFYVYASVIAFLAGIPIFDLTTFPGYTPVWAVLLGASAVASSIGSLSDHWQKLERWATMALSALLMAYVLPLNALAFIEGDLDRQYAGILSIIAAVLPWTRFVYLAAQAGKRPYVRTRQ